MREIETSNAGLQQMRLRPVHDISTRMDGRTDRRTDLPNPQRSPFIIYLLSLKARKLRYFQDLVNGLVRLSDGRTDVPTYIEMRGRI